MMHHSSVLPILVLLCLFLAYTCVAENNCKNEARCEINRAYKMKAINCYSKEFRTFPKCIATDAEVLELSHNRIRKVTKSDLAQFKYLKILYLTDNLIQNLDEEAFQNMDSLHTLDVSLNALIKLPPGIFQLPSLKTLYAGQNLNMNIVDALEVKPISSPLQHIDISLTTDEDNVSNFPDFGPLPLLKSLNITANYYSKMTPKHFAGLCNLDTLSNVNVTVEYADECDCWVINNWLTERKVTFTLFTCNVEKDSCPSVEVNEEDVGIYRKCREVYDEIERQNLLKKIGIGAAIVISLIAAGVFVYFVFIKKAFCCEMGKKGQTQNNHASPPRTDGLQLLNNKKFNSSDV